MNITFGITTDYSSIERLDSIINSINLLNIPKYEILIIGNKKIDSHGVVNYIEFDSCDVGVKSKQCNIPLDRPYFIGKYSDYLLVTHGVLHTIDMLRLLHRVIYNVYNKHSINSVGKSRNA